MRPTWDSLPLILLLLAGGLVVILILYLVS